MNKKEIQDFLVEQEVAASKAEAGRQFDAFVEAIKTGLKSDGEVFLSGVGKLKVKPTKARKGRNPKTGDEIQIPASKTVSFKAAKPLKDLVRSEA